MHGPPPYDMIQNYQARPPRFNNYANEANFRHRAPFNYQKQNYFNGLRSSTEHWCETCDRSFPTSDLLKKHIQQHQKCNIDGCQFVAHPKVVTKHIQMQHASGLYKKIANLNNPEEIKKWREERKRKYPTKLNIEKKAAERKEKFDRGEKIGLATDGQKKNFKSDSMKRNSAKKVDHQRKKQRSNLTNNTAVNHVKKVFVPKKIHEVLPAVDSLRKLMPFAGIQDIIRSCTENEEKEEAVSDLDIEDEDDLKIADVVTIENIIEPKVCGALSSLMCDYESSEEELNEEDIDKVASKVSKILPVNISQRLNNNPIDRMGDKAVNVSKDNKSDEEKAVQTMIAKQANKDDKCIGTIDDKELKYSLNITNSENKITESKCTDKSDDESAPEEIKIDKPTEVETENKASVDNTIKVKKSYLDKIRKHPYRKPKPKVPSTLLRKLLHREIQQERNIVLQSIRYVVNNNFFDK